MLCSLLQLDEGPSLDPTARGVYLVNCLAAMQAPLAAHECCAERAAELGEAIEGHVAALVGREVSFFC